MQPPDEHKRSVYSPEMQNNSCKLDAHLRPIKEQAERDGVERIRVYLGASPSTRLEILLNLLYHNPDTARGLYRFALT